MGSLPLGSRAAIIRNTSATRLEMPPPFNASSMRLEELLAGRHRLRVPGYQRAFSWTFNEAGQLLDDLLSALDDAEGGEGDYFLGAVILMEVGSSALSRLPGEDAPMPVYEIVDGLQRLVTLTILFAVLRDIADDDEAASERASYCIADPTLLYEEDEGCLRLTLPDAAQAFFYAFVQEHRATSAMPDDDDLSAPEKRLLAVREHLMAALVGESAERRRRLVEFLRTGCHCAVIIARTLDRAHRIFAVINDRGMPLSRSDILRAEILGSVAPERRDELTGLWRAAEQGLGGSMEDLLSHLRTIEGRSRTRIIDEIRMLVARSGDAEAFLTETLLPYASILSLIRLRPEGSAQLAPDIRSRLGYLGWLGSQDWVPPLMLHWRTVEGRPEQVAPFLKRLDRLAFGLRLLGVGLDKRAGRYRALIDAIRSGAPDGANHPLELSRDELRLILHNLRALHARSQLACKLVLLRLNDAIAGVPQNLDPGDFTVEHVLPQKPGRNSEWRQWFPVAEERERWTQSLGNLILVSRHKNEEARNLEFVRKREIYFDGKAALPLISRDIEGLAEWRPDVVQGREEWLTRVLDDMWAFGTGRASAGAADGASSVVRARPRPLKPRPLFGATARR